MKLDVVKDYKEPGRAVRGRTLPSLLDEACEKNPLPNALNQWIDGQWEALSTVDLRRRSEELALGLQELDLAKGDRVSLFMHSDTDFCIADMACLIAGVVDVPIYLTHTPETIRYVLKHAQARALIVSDMELLDRLTLAIEELPQLRTILVARPEREPLVVSPFFSEKRIEVVSVAAVSRIGQRHLAADPEAADRLKRELSADDLATIVYTSGTTGEPKGVMLSHENISFDVFSSFTGLDGLEPGSGEVALSFLPLTHAFARTMHYGYVLYGVEVYFTSVENLGEHLRSVRPTTFATVPRVLEKFYDKLLQKGGELSGLSKGVFNWGLGLARRYQLGQQRQRFSRFRYALSNRLVFSKWRDALGGRIRFIISGGAALRSDLVNTFAAAGIHILQGYGLTESSPTISFNRPPLNRPGSVGKPLAGVEVKIAEDGEILTRGPHVMKGYYRNPQATRECLSPDGWLHTGDIGEITQEGLLRVTDRKKDLFKLSTGKYVTPQPLENTLIQDPLVDQVVVTGRGRPFCSALIFPERQALGQFARSQNIDPKLSAEELLNHPAVTAYFEDLVETANQSVDPWSGIKRYALVASPLSVENGLLTPTLKVRRGKVEEAFAGRLEGIYSDAKPGAKRA